MFSGSMASAHRGRGNHRQPSSCKTLNRLLATPAFVDSNEGALGPSPGGHLADGLWSPEAACCKRLQLLQELSVLTGSGLRLH